MSTKPTPKKISNFVEKINTFLKNQYKLNYSHFLYLLVTIMISIITYSITTLIKLDSMLLNVCIIGIICIIVPNILYYLCYRKYYLFDISKKFCLSLIKK